MILVNEFLINRQLFEAFSIWKVMSHKIIIVTTELLDSSCSFVGKENCYCAYNFKVQYCMIYCFRTDALGTSFFLINSSFQQVLLLSLFALPETKWLLNLRFVWHPWLPKASHFVSSADSGYSCWSIPDVFLRCASHAVPY